MEHNRKKFIGGTEAGIILGYRANLGGDMQMTPYQLWERYLAEEEEEISKEKQLFFDRRRCLESYAMERVNKELTALIVNKNQRYYFDDTCKGCYEFPEIDSFITAEIDFEISGAPGIHINGEIKTVSSYSAYIWGESGTTDIPLYVQAQVMHGLMVTGRHKCLIVALIGLDDIRYYWIQRDQEIIDLMLHKEIEFWNCVQTRTPPPEPYSLSDINTMFRKSNIPETYIEAEQEIVGLLENLRQTKANIKSLEVMESQLEKKVKEYMGNNSILTDSVGNKLASWKSQTTNRFDSTEFKQANPELYSDFIKTTESRVFRINK